MRKSMILLILVALSACVTPAERAAQQEHEVAEMIQIYGPACEKLGYQANTDQWRSCILNLDAKANNGRPVTTSCFGPRGFVQCTTY
jgi:hypothetical protein